jgi:hypothetical protein
MPKSRPNTPNSCPNPAGSVGGTVAPCPAASTAADLQRNAAVQQAMNDAWRDSQANDPAHRHEEGGWIYQDTTTGQITTRRAPGGAQASLDLSHPPEVPGSVVVGKFHTHPNPTSEGWDPGPSNQDTRVDALHGVPDLIKADDGVHTSGPDSRRGGMGGGPGFPP